MKRNIILSLILIGLTTFNFIGFTNNNKNVDQHSEQQKNISNEDSETCQKDISETDNNSDTKSNETSKVTNNKENNTNNNFDKIENTSSYEISEETYTKQNIKIKYPQLKNLNDCKKCDLINKNIKDQALAVLNYYDLSNSNAILNVSYDIEFQSSDNLSIVYKGDFNSGNSAYPVSVFYTTNIDIKKGENIRLKDYSNVNELFNNLRNSNKHSDIAVTQELAQAQTEYLSNIDDSTLKYILANADFYKSNENIQFPEAFSYRKNDNIIIGISVPHAIGDYAEFLVKN